MSRSPVNFDYNEDHCKVLVARQSKADENNDNLMDSVLIPEELTIAVQ